MQRLTSFLVPALFLAVVSCDVGEPAPVQSDEDTTSAPPDTGGGNRSRAPRGTPLHGTIVPLYIYPDATSWGRVADAQRAHPGVTIVAVVNPNSGPGTIVDPAYTAGIQSLVSAGVTVIGYVHTSYGQRAASAVRGDIDRWFTFYPAIDGIFFDEQNNIPGGEGYYFRADAYARKRGAAFTVANPGADTAESYVGTADVVLIYERAGLPALEGLGGWHERYAPEEFGIIPHAVAFDPAFVALARNTAGYIYLTPDTLPNPWDTLPPYFEQLVAALD